MPDYSSFCGVAVPCQAGPAGNLAILAALTFAEELERLRREHQELISHLEALNERLSAAIDGHE